MRSCVRRFVCFWLCVVTFLAFLTPMAHATRIKDVADFEGVRDNMLVGYGLVVGLDGTGDSLNKAVFTKESFIAMLDRLGVRAREEALDSKNIAAVMVTANLPAFARSGSRIDASISAIGDSESLRGGTLLVTPLMGADGSVYAVAQGPVAIGGFSAGGAATSVTQGVPTNGRIASGAIVEQELPFQLNGMKSIRLALKNPDFTTSQRIAKAINNSFGSDLARSADSGTVELTTPMGYENNIAQLITQVEQLNVTPDAPARVVINESTGVVVIGDNVRISRVAIAQGNLTIRVTETPQVSQPGAFAEVGQTAIVDRTKVDVLDDGKEKKLAIVNGGVSLQELVTGLNALGIGPRDMISILQAIKAAGALQAEIEVM